MICKNSTEWKARVKVRDDFKCRICGTSDGKMIAHHIVEMEYIGIKGKYNKESDLDTDNGICICQSCHSKHHNTGRKHTEESKLQIGLTRKKNGLCKGETHYRFGKQQPQEVKHKMSIARKGMKLSEESKDKMKYTRFKTRTTKDFVKKYQTMLDQQIM